MGGMFMGFFDFLFKKQSSSTDTETKQLSSTDTETIKQHVKLLGESVGILNNSCDLESVVFHFETACNSLRILSGYSDEDIKNAGCYLNQPPKIALESILEKRITIINEAIQRNFSLVKSPEAVNTLYISLRDLEGLDDNNISFLEKLYQKLVSEIHGFTDEIIEHHVEFRGESETIKYIGTSSIYRFVSDCTQAMQARRDSEKIQLLEKQLPLFPTFIKSALKQDGQLPPCVACRDSLPELYMRYGKWYEAERVIRLSISCNAYGHIEYKNNQNYDGNWIPESGNSQLEWLNLCHKAADTALTYIAKNPGICQSQIYKLPEFASVHHDALVWFCRNSHQIRKEKEGKTNHLFIMNESLL